MPDHDNAPAAPDQAALRLGLIFYGLGYLINMCPVIYVSVCIGQGANTDPAFNMKYLAVALIFSAMGMGFIVKGALLRKRAMPH